MRMKKRAVFTLALEIAVLVLTFCIILVSMSADRTINEFDKREYPREYSDAVEIASAEFDIPENLIYAVIKAESDFDAEAISSSGAMGLMQIMPSTYENDIKPKLGFGKSGKDALFNYIVNIRSGTYYLSSLYKYCGDIETALAMYNAGIGNVRSWLKNRDYSYDGKKLIAEKIPVPETRTYVARVMYYYERYNDIYGVDRSKVVEDPIFEKYGVKIKWVTRKGSNGTVYVNELACYAWAQHYAEIYPEADPILVMAIIRAESDFRVNVVSKSDAYGLMQILEPTYDDLKDIMPTTRPFSHLLKDPQYAVKCGMCYIQWLHTPSLGLSGNRVNIAAAYNGGCGNAKAWLSQSGLVSGGVLIADKIPREETRNYVKKVMANYEYYREYLGLIYSKEN
jgi:soluble lytic murein transglycosylase